MEQPVLYFHLQLNSEDLGEEADMVQLPLFKQLQRWVWQLTGNFHLLQLPGVKGLVQAHSASGECWQMACSLALGYKKSVALDVESGGHQAMLQSPQQHKAPAPTSKENLHGMATEL